MSDVLLKSIRFYFAKCGFKDGDKILMHMFHLKFQYQDPAKLDDILISNKIAKISNGEYYYVAEQHS